MVFLKITLILTLCLSDMKGCIGISKKVKKMNEIKGMDVPLSSLLLLSVNQSRTTIFHYLLDQTVL